MKTYLNLKNFVLILLGSLILYLILGQKTIPNPKASPLTVVVSIKPIHSLVAGVTDGVLEPTLLIDSHASAHTYSLTPGDAKLLSGVGLFVWVGPIYETHIKNTVDKLVPDDKVLMLYKATNQKLLPNRTGSFFPAGCSDHAHDHGDNTDGHIWLNPENAIGIVDAVARELAKRDYAHADQYLDNAKKVIEKLKALDVELQALLKPVQKKPYLQYHDAMHYFDQHFGTTSIGSVTIEPDMPPSAQHFIRLRALLADKNNPLCPLCLFFEPQSINQMNQKLASEFSIPFAMLDYLGKDQKPGPDAYFEIMRGIAHTLIEGLVIP
ncbi:MAG: zinc ABC transporter substrate-binding protein [Alphaproteobacteria bacterium]|nr:zinc ABC transporter substrate-binding protein [Alphaproteobacteria bacterium]